jgi:hypothetical protein
LEGPTDNGLLSVNTISADGGIVENVPVRIQCDNCDNGLDVDFASNIVNISDGNYNNNQEAGLDISGEGERIQRVNISKATAINNVGNGLILDEVNSGLLERSNFSSNQNGIELYNVGGLSTKLIHARSNRENGLISDVGESAQVIDPHSSSSLTLDGELELQQSFFNDNGTHGVLIAGVGAKDDTAGVSELPSQVLYDYHLDFDRVSAQSNGGSGVFFGNRLAVTDPAIGVAGHGLSVGEPGGQANFDVRFDRGNYSNNQGDGVRAVASDVFEDVLAVVIKAETFRTTMNNNGGNGFHVDALSSKFDLYIRADKGDFSRNGGDGIEVKMTNHAELEGTFLEEPNLIFTGVAASRNGGDGLRVESVFESADIFDGLGSYTTSPVANVSKSAFNDNGFSGLYFEVTTEHTNDSALDSQIQLDRLSAKRNGRNGVWVNGLTATGAVSAIPRAIQVEFTRGVFNVNQADGLRFSNVRSVNFDRTLSISNKDDGFDGNNVDDVLGKWTFAANRDRDFHLEGSELF